MYLKRTLETNGRSQTLCRGIATDVTLVLTLVCSFNTGSRGLVVR